MAALSIGSVDLRCVRVPGWLALLAVSFRLALPGPQPVMHDDDDLRLLARRQTVRACTWWLPSDTVRVRTMTMEETSSGSYRNTGPGHRVGPHCVGPTTR